MTTKPFKIETTFNGKPTTLHFSRKNGILAFSNFNIHSEDEKYIFSIKHEGDRFIVHNIKSSDTSNLFFKEMEKTIKNRFFAKTCG